MPGTLSTTPGKEAEELRSGIERIVEQGFEDEEEITAELRTLLDDVDARDSLTYICAQKDIEARLSAEVAELTAIKQRHLELIAKMTRETPYEGELEQCRSSCRALVAEVGTLRARLAEIEGR